MNPRALLLKPYCSLGIPKKIIQPVIQISVMQDANRMSPRWQLIAIGDRPRLDRLNSTLDNAGSRATFVTAICLKGLGVIINSDEYFACFPDVIHMQNQRVGAGG